MPRFNNPVKTWQYTNELKAKAVQLSLFEGIQVKIVVETLDIHFFMPLRYSGRYTQRATKRKSIMPLVMSF